MKSRFVVFVMALCLAALSSGSAVARQGASPIVPATVQAAPASDVDQTKVPHYFGPYPNWANSPLTLPDVTVVISGDGTGAKAEATVGANGAITAITLIDGGQGYNNAKVDFNRRWGLVPRPTRRS